MPLENLVSTIEALKKRINTHRSDLAAIEARTRAALIDPVLTALGWDTSDPGLVMVEQRLRGGKADYALLKPDGNPISIVEAKALGSQLDKVTDQLINYAFAEGIPYAVSTDGDWWQVYDLTKPSTQIDNRLILQLSILNDPFHECAVKLLLLWYPNLVSGTPVEAEIPMASHTTNDQDSNNIIAPDTNTQKTQSNFDNSGWISLENCDPPTGTPGPYKVRFPDGSEKPIYRGAWSKLFETTVEWLWTSQLLTYADIPIAYSDDPNAYYILNTIPERSPGDPMPYKRQMDSPPLYYNNNPGMRYLIHCTKRVLEHCNQNPSEVYIQPRQ